MPACLGSLCDNSITTVCRKPFCLFHCCRRRENMSARIFNTLYERRNGQAEMKADDFRFYGFNDATIRFIKRNPIWYWALRIRINAEFRIVWCQMLLPNLLL